MQVTLIEQEGNRCALLATGVSSNTLFPLTIPSFAFIDGLRALLSSPETKELNFPDCLNLVRTSESIDVVTSAGKFVIPYAYVFPMVSA